MARRFTPLVFKLVWQVNIAVCHIPLHLTATLRRRRMFEGRNNLTQMAVLMMHKSRKEGCQDVSLVGLLSPD